MILQLIIDIAIDYKVSVDTVLTIFIHSGLDDLQSSYYFVKN